MGRRPPGSGPRLPRTWFSAFLLPFAAALQQQADVPIGMVAISAFAPSCSTWPSPEAFADDAACQEWLAKLAAAWGAFYGAKTEIYGPVYASQAIERGRIRLTFNHVGQGLAFRPADKPQGFAIAGKDKQFPWVKAVIDGDAVVVSSDKVPDPVAVRYAWAAQHPWANLFNKDGPPGDRGPSGPDTDLSRRDRTDHGRSGMVEPNPTGGTMETYARGRLDGLSRKD